MTYTECEKAVYDFFMKKHKEDQSFTFTVRRNASKGAEKDYFIGTSNSGYFSTSFWSIPVAFPGSTGELISLLFELKNNSIFYRFEFNQTKSPHDEQNTNALELLEILKPEVDKAFGIDKEAMATAKTLNYRVISGMYSLDEINEACEDACEQLQILKPIVQTGINKIKESSPEFYAHEIPKAEFDRMIQKMEERQARIYDDIQVVPEVASQDIEKKPDEFPYLNQILFGPPGTGKTYSAISEAVKICSPKFASTEREDIKAEYDRLVEAEQIVFTTFHQSTSYEDFVEGIKPETDGEKISYEVLPGIFKTLCQRAKSIKSKSNVNIDWPKSAVFKMSLGGKNMPEIHNWCIENNLIAMGYGGEKDLSVYNKYMGDWDKFRDAFSAANPDLVEESRFNTQAAHAFLRMKKGDLVVVTKGNHVIDAVGKITGDYFYSDEKPIEYFHYRKVEWIATNMNTTPDRFVQKQISQQTIYEFEKHDLIESAFLKLSNNQAGKDEKPLNYVLIIDEINRGNVSQIFGELITLLEPDKRIGNKEELRVLLPYSKHEEEPFGVPNNIYLVGTMNTADRSVEALDTALRRRFAFKEIAPQPLLLKTEGKLDDGILQIDGMENGYALDFILSSINDRIEFLIDKDHMIGHSYFLGVKNLKDLKEVFAQKLIPLLQEYFYGDFGKISLVLGDGFCRLKKGNKLFDNYFAQTESAKYTDYSDRQLYIVHDALKMDDGAFIKALNLLLNILTKTDES